MMRTTWLALSLLLVPVLSAAEAANDHAATEGTKNSSERTAEGKQGSSAAGTESSVDVAAVVAKVQAFYEKAEGMDARFTQTFRHGGIPSRLGGSTAQGRLRIRKPRGDASARMRWDYDDGRMILVVGELAYTYDPDTKQITLYRLDARTLSAAVTFLWGKGNLADDFEISRSTRTDLGEGVALDLVPRKASEGFSKVHLVVDESTGIVRRSVVVQADGSENHFAFREPKIADVPLSEFDPDRVFPADAVRVDTQLRR